MKEREVEGSSRVALAWWWQFQTRKAQKMQKGPGWMPQWPQVRVARQTDANQV